MLDFTDLSRRVCGDSHTLLQIKTVPVPVRNPLSMAGMGHMTRTPWQHIHNALLDFACQNVVTNGRLKWTLPVRTVASLSGFQSWSFSELSIRILWKIKKKGLCFNHMVTSIACLLTTLLSSNHLIALVVFPACLSILVEIPSVKSNSQYWKMARRFAHGVPETLSHWNE